MKNSDNAKIEWTDATWNPVTGCTKVSAGCKNCYAERDWARLSANPKTVYYGRAFTDVQCHSERLDHQPLRWTKPRRIFVNSMSDLFHDSVPFAFIAAVFGVMAAAHQHTFQVLTKRPERMLEFFKWVEMREEVGRRMFPDDSPGWRIWQMLYVEARNATANVKAHHGGEWPLPNVWIGVSIENQDTADERIPLLLRTPAAVRWVSAEPLLGTVDLSKFMGRYNEHFGEVDWVVGGGESGSKARPMHPYWVRGLRDQCTAVGVPFLFKQWGEWFPDGSSRPPERDLAGVLPSGDFLLYSDGYRAPVADANFSFGTVRNDGRTLMARVGKKSAGRSLDGATHNGYPE